MSNSKYKMLNTISREKMVYIIGFLASIVTLIAFVDSYFLGFWDVTKVLTVRVTDQKGSAVSRAEVQLLSNEVSLKEHTDIDGLARFSIPSATLTNGYLIVETDEYEIYESNIDLPTDSRIDVRLDELDPTSGHIILRVIDDQKNPLSNTELQLFIENNVYQQVADSNGIAKFSVPFSGQQIDVLITAKNQGFEVKDQRITLWVNQTQDVLLNPETLEIEVVEP